MKKTKNVSDDLESNHGIAWPVRCVNCGEGEISPRTAPGRTASYKNMSGLELPESLPIPTCDACGEQWINRTTAQAMDAALEQQYQRRLTELATVHLEKLGAQHITQRRLEKILGLSQGYLSKVRAGASRPSQMLVSCLFLLATDPEGRLREMEESLAAA